MGAPPCSHSVFALILQSISATFHEIYTKAYLCINAPTHDLPAKVLQGRKQQIKHRISASQSPAVKQAPIELTTSRA